MTSDALDTWNLDDPDDAREFLVKVRDMGKLMLEPGDEGIEDWADDRVIAVAIDVARKAGVKFLTVH